MNLRGLFLNKPYWLIIFLIPQICHSYILDKDDKIAVINDFSGGLVTNKPSSKLSPNESPNLRNFYIDNDKLEEINGYILAGTNGAMTKVTNMFEFNKEDGSREFIVTDSSRVYTTTDFNTFTLITNSLSGRKVPNFFQARNKVWGVNGIDPAFTWDGSTRIVLDGSLQASTRTPNVPIMAYGSYYQERVFLFNSTYSASSLRYTTLVDTGNNIINPDNFLAWPLDHELFIGQGDGQNGSAIWKQDGQLKLGKERSIYTLFGSDHDNYNAQISIPDVGVISNDCVVQQNGIAYFFGSPPGIYAYAQDKIDLLTENIDADMRNVFVNLANLVSTTWDSFSDFANGSVLINSTVTVGSVEKYSGYRDDTIYTDLGAARALNRASLVAPSGGEIFLDDIVSTSTAWMIFHPTNTFPSNGNFKVGNTNVTPQFAWAESTGTCTLNFYFRNLNGEVNTGAVDNLNFSYNNGGASRRSLSGNDPVVFSGSEINGGSVAVKASLNVSAPGACTSFGLFYPTNTFASEFIMVPIATGTYISNVATITNVITAWDTFNADIRQTNGSVSFYYRTATSAVNITTYPWISIIPGNLVGSAVTDKYIQWAASFTSTAQQLAGDTGIDKVEILHNEGGATDSRPIGTSWKNRIMIAVTTNSTGNTNLIYVKSRSNSKNPKAFTVIEGINIKSFLKRGDESLYGGSAISSSIFKLDTGMTFNGTNISAYYETPDLHLGDFYLEDKQQMFWLDTDKNSTAGSTIGIGYSVNGSTYTSVSYSINGTGRLLRSIYKVPDTVKNGFYFRYRFYNDGAYNLTINSFAVVYRPSQVMP